METDYNLIKAKNYQTHCDACERILDHHGIIKSLGAASVDLYLSIIASEPDNPKPEEYQKFEKTIDLLKKYVAKHGKSVDYATYTTTRLNEVLLETCNVFIKQF